MLRIDAGFVQASSSFDVIGMKAAEWDSIEEVVGVHHLPLAADSIYEKLAIPSCVGSSGPDVAAVRPARVNLPPEALPNAYLSHIVYYPTVVL